MTDSPTDFASLLCSRLCHDLLSPVGSITNGLELLADEDDPALQKQYLELLTDSARASADKLKFFRLAFGAAGGFGETIDANEVKAAIQGLVRGNQRIMFDWLAEAPTLPRATAKVTLNLALVAIDALVRGGRLDIGIEGDEIVARAEGPRLVLDAAIRGVLAGEASADAISGRTSAIWLARFVAEQAGGRLMVRDDVDGVLVLGATMPA